MATLFDSASLVMIPSGVKEDKLYSIKPTDGSGDFTFSRDADIEATRVNSSGLIEKAKVNLLEQSNSFDTWSATSGSSVTSGQSGYDGSSDAWLLTDSGNNSAYAIYRGYTNTGVQTFSIYAKQASTSQIEFDFLGGSSGYLRAELTDGSLHSTLGTIDYKIEDAGGGWWRCSFSANNTSAPILVRIGCNGAGSIYIQDAQVNHGLIAQDYVETTTTAVVEGLTADLPRLDYSGGASCPSLLLEPSRTNSFQQSEYFGAVWTNTNSSEESNSAISPEGVQNATKLLDAATTGDHSIQSEAVAIAYNTIATASIYVKRGTLPAVQLRLINSGGSFAYYIIDVDLTDGSLISAINTGTSDRDNNITPVGDDWYRIDMRCSFNDSGNTSRRLQVYTHNGTSHSYAGDGTGSIYLYGAQLEAGSYPTSYIPTYGTAANRGADAMYKTGISSLIGQTEGTLFLEFNTANADNTSFIGETILGVSNGTTNRILIYADSYVRAQVRTDGSVQATLTGDEITSNTTYKCAIAYKQNDLAFFVNGVLVDTDTSANIPATTDLRNDSGSGISSAIVPIKQTLLFKTRLTNAELAALTTI